MVVICHDFGGSVFIQSTLDSVLLLNWSPEITNKALVLPLHLVEGSIQGLFLCQEHLVDVDGGGGSYISISFDLIELNQLVSERLLSSLKHTLSIRD